MTAAEAAGERSMRSSTRFTDRRNMRSPISFNDFQQPLRIPSSIRIIPVDRNKDACIHVYFIHVRARLQGLTLTCLILSLNIALRNHKIRNHIKFFSKGQRKLDEWEGFKDESQGKESQIVAPRRALSNYRGFMDVRMRASACINNVRVRI